MNFPSQYAESIREIFKRKPGRSLEIILKLLLARLRYGFGPSHFLLFNLQDRPYNSWNTYFETDGTIRPIMKVANRTSRSSKIVQDKLLASQILLDKGISVAPISAVLGRSETTHTSTYTWPVINDRDELSRFLDSDICPKELFSKPVRGSGGDRVIVATRNDQDWLVEKIHLSTNAMAELLLQGNNEYGRLLQPRLRNHNSIERLAGTSGLSTLRVITAIQNGEPHLIAATQKLVGPDNTTDNFLGGTTGNIIAAVDISSGILGLGYGRTGNDRFFLSKLDAHPGTGERIIGTPIPMWNELVDITLRAALAFKEQPFLGFDIVSTTDGPMVLEANTEWSFALPQITTEKGGKLLLRENLIELDIPDDERQEALQLLQNS